jgi:hypothetical protein
MGEGGDWERIVYQRGAGARRIKRAAVTAGGERLIFVCSSAVFGKKTSEKTSDICPFRSFSIPLNLIGY